MHIGTYVAEKHILDDGVMAIEIRAYFEGKSRELVFSIDEVGNMVLSDKIRNAVANESMPDEP